MSLKCICRIFYVGILMGMDVLEYTKTTSIRNV